jgi:hypothetical protein
MTQSKEKIGRGLQTGIRIHCHCTHQLSVSSPGCIKHIPRKKERREQLQTRQQTVRKETSQSISLGSLLEVVKKYHQKECTGFSLS